MTRSSLSDNKKKIGRPATGIGTLVGVRMPPEELSHLDAWIERRPGHLSRPEALRALAKLGLAADQQARSKAKSDAKGERDADAAQATADYAALQRAEDEKTARLREVRLAKEARDKRLAAPSEPPPAAMTEKARKKLAAEKGAAPEKRTANAARAKELAAKAVDVALTKVDASEESKTARKRALVERPAKKRS